MSDLFKFFDAANAEDYEYVDRMTDDEVKKISPFVLTMWAHGANRGREAHVILTDQLFNENVFSHSKHPRLLLKLWMTANSGDKATRYSFVKTTTENDLNVLRCIAMCYDCGLDEARDIKRLLTKEEIDDLKEMYGECV